MATNVTSTLVQELYTDIVSDLKVFIDDAVLLPNSQFLMTSFDISGQSGNTVRVPISPAFTDAAAVAEGGDIIGAAEDNFTVGSVDVTMQKYGVGVDITEESLEDGGVALVRDSLLRRLSGGLAQAVDKAGFVALRDAGGNASVNQDGLANVGVGFDTSIVMDSSALAYASKRQPSVRMWYDPNSDVHQFRASTRCGFAPLFNGADTDFGVRKITDHTAIGSAVTTLDEIAKSVANLRAGNYMGMSGSGMFAAFISPAVEYSIASQLNSVTETAIGDLSQIGNRALLTGLIGQAAGCEFYRTNNLAQANS